MRRFLAGFGLFAAVALLSARQDEPEKKAKQPVKAKAAEPAVRFNATPSAIAGAASDTQAVAVSRDGRRIASSGGSLNPATGFISVVDAESRKELLAMRVPRPFNSVGISPDGKLLAVTGQAAEMTVLDVDGGKTLFTKRLDGAAQLAFAPDGKSVATVTQAKSVQIWDVPSGNERVKLPGATAPLRCVAFSGDGKKLFAAGGDTRTGVANTLFVWDVAGKKLETKFETTSPTEVIALAASMDGSAVVGSDDFHVRIWDVANAKVKVELAQQQAPMGVAFSPDGNLIAAAMGTGPIRLWNSSNGAELGVLEGHVEACRCVAFAEGGKKLVSGGALRSLKLWDVPGKKELASLRQDERINAVPLAMAVTRDGSMIALASETGVTLRDGGTGELKADLKGHDDAVTCVAFSPDGKTLASGSTDKTIKLWDVAKGKERATIKGHTNWVYALAFKHDGTTLASGGYDRTVRFWDAATGDPKGQIEAHRGSIRAIAFSPDDKLLATGGSDRLVKVWSVADRKSKFEMKGHTGAVRALAFSPDGKALASGGEDGFVKFWNPADGKELVPTTKIHQEEVNAVAFVGNSTLLSGGADPIIRHWDVASGTAPVALTGHAGGVAGIAVPAGSASFVSAGADRVVKRFREEAPGPVRLFTGHTGVVQWASFAPNGKRFVSCGHWPEGDKTLRIWDVESGMEVLKIEHPGQAAIVVYSPDGKHIASACNDSKAYLWDAETGDPVRTFKGHTAGLNGIAFNKDGTRLLTSGGDKTARVWDTTTGGEVQKFAGHTAMVRRVAFHPDGKHAFSAGRDAVVRMWNLETAKEVKQFKSSGKWADCLAIAMDGKHLATAGDTVRVYEIESGKMIAECVGHQFGVTHVAFSNDGKRLLSTAYDGTGRLWERDTGKELYRFRGHREFLWCAAFSPDGNWVLTGGGGAGTGDGKWTKGADHAIRLWRMPDERTLAEFPPEN